MNIVKYFWDLNKTAIGEVEKILRNPRHPKFILRMVTLLSRCEKPNELFSLISKKDFIENWPKIRVHWLKVSRQSDFREWWETIYEQLLQKYKNQAGRPKGSQSTSFIKIGKAIKDARINHTLSQKELAIMVGMKQPDISKIEEGKKNITLKTLITLFRALNITKINLT